MVGSFMVVRWLDRIPNRGAIIGGSDSAFSNLIFSVGFRVEHQCHTPAQRQQKYYYFSEDFRVTR